MKVDVYFTIFIKLISQNIKVNKSSASHKVSLQISYYAEKEFQKEKKFENDQG